jgi:hypothetical protein
MQQGFSAITDMLGLIRADLDDLHKRIECLEGHAEPPK